MTSIILTPAAELIVAADVAAESSARIRYASYVTEMGVELDTVKDHVAIFRNAFKNANPDADGDSVKAYATKVRNGLNYQLGKKSERAEGTELLTSKGKEATLEEVTAAWHAAQQ